MEFLMIKSSRRMLRGRLVVAVLSAAIVATGCGSDEPTTEPPPDDSEASDSESPMAGDAMDELVAAAQEEGQLVWYNALTGIDEPAARAFEERYGITVENTRVPTSDLQARYGAEQDAGAPSADVVVISESPFIDDSISKGWVTPLDEAGIPGYPWDYPALFLQDGRAVVQARPWGILYDPNVMSEDEVPTSFAAWADPEWAGIAAAPNPAASPAYNSIWNLMFEEYGGADFIRAVSENTEFYPSGAPMYEAVIAGEAKLGMLGNGNATASGDLAIVIPEKTTTNWGSVMISANAANPNAARLFAYWLMTEEGNQVISDAANVKTVFDPEVATYLFVKPEDMPDGRMDEIIGLLGL